MSKDSHPHPLFSSSFEDREILSALTLLLRKRKVEISASPQKGESIVLLLSGGIDSIGLWYILLSRYKAQVYPLHIRKNRLFDKQTQSIAFFSRLFSLLFPKQYHAPLIESISQKVEKSPKIIAHKTDRFTNLSLSNMVVDEKSSRLQNIVPASPSRLGHLLLFAYSYAHTLQGKGISITCITQGVVAEDAAHIRESSTTVLRAFNVALSLIFQNWSIRFLNPTNKKNNYFLSKEKLLIQFGGVIPFEKTWSCENNFLFHCGFCYKCIQRKEMFKKANRLDKTLYLVSEKQRLLTRQIVRIVKDFLQKGRRNTPGRLTQKDTFFLAPDVVARFPYLYHQKNKKLIKLNKQGVRITEHIMENKQTNLNMLISGEKKKDGSVKKDVVVFVNTLFRKGYIQTKYDK